MGYHSKAPEASLRNAEHNGADRKPQGQRPDARSAKGQRELSNSDEKQPETACPWNVLHPRQHQAASHRPPQLIRKDCGAEFTSRRANSRCGQPGKIGNASQVSKLSSRMMMRPVTASQYETTFPEPRENGASTLLVVLGDDGPGVGRRRRGFRQASHLGCTLRATPISGKRLSPSASIKRGATLYPTCDSGAESSSVTTHDDGPTMRRRGRTDPGTPRHPRIFTRPPPLLPGHVQRSSPILLSPIFPIWSKKVTISGRKWRRESASFFLPV